MTVVSSPHRDFALNEPSHSNEQSSCTAASHTRSRCQTDVSTRRVVSNGDVPYSGAVGFPWHRYLTSAARTLLGDEEDAPALISSRHLALHAEAIAAPIIEVSGRRGAVLAAVFRACRQADAIVVIAVDSPVRRSSPQAAGRVVEGIAAAARTGHHGLPIVVVARAEIAPLFYAPGSDPVDAALERISRDLDAGYGAVAVTVDVAGDANSVERLVALLADVDVGLELDIGRGEDAALLLAEIYDRGVDVAAVRGAAVHDDIGGASRVVDVGAVSTLEGIDVGGLRVNIDALLDHALQGIDASNDDAVEATAWMTVSRALAALKAGGSATRLAHALGLDDDDQNENGGAL